MSLNYQVNKPLASITSLAEDFQCKTNLVGLRNDSLHQSPMYGEISDKVVNKECSLLSGT